MDNNIIQDSIGHTGVSLGFYKSIKMEEKTQNAKNLSILREILFPELYLLQGRMRRREYVPLCNNQEFHQF